MLEECRAKFHEDDNHPQKCIDNFYEEKEKKLSWEWAQLHVIENLKNNDLSRWRVYILSCIKESEIRSWELVLRDFVNMVGPCSLLCYH